MLVGLLQVHGIESAAVAEQGCGAIGKLAVGNAANAAALAAAGAYEGELVRA